MRKSCRKLLNGLKKGSLFGCAYLTLSASSGAFARSIGSAENRKQPFSSVLQAQNDGGGDDTAALTERLGLPVVPLKNFHFRPESLLLEELGVRRDSDYESAADEMATWFSKAKSGARLEISKKCEALLGHEPKGFKPDVQNLPCIPWYLDKLAQARDAKKRKLPAAKVTPPLMIGPTVPWETLRGQPFSTAFQRIDPVTLSELDILKNHAKGTLFDCNFAGATSALIARAESLLPEEKVFEVIEELYPGAFACLEPDMDGFERTHQRVGLLRLLQGQSQKARQSLLLAARAEEPKEEFRSLFWLGVLKEAEATENETVGRVTNPPAVQNEYWAELTKRYSLSLHAIVAAHSQGRDPVEFLKGEEGLLVARRLGQDWNEFNLTAFAFELLVARQEAIALSGLSGQVARSLEVQDPRAALFLGICHNQAQNYRSSIASLSQYMRDTRSQHLSLDLLNLLYPRPFADEILSHSKNVDPVLVFSLIRQESAFEPFARSVADARGLMQVLPSTARKFISSKEDLYDPIVNIKAGVSYMEELLKRYNGKVEHVLAAYNAGGRHLERWRVRFPQANTLLFSDLIPFRETRTYVSIIQRNAYWYGRLMVLKDDRLAKVMVTRSRTARWRSETVSQLLGVAWARQGAPQAVAAVANLFSLSELSALGRLAQTRAQNSVKPVEITKQPEDSTLPEGSVEGNEKNSP